MGSKPATNVKELNGKLDQLSTEFNAGLSMLREQFASLKRNNNESKAPNKEPERIGLLESQFEKFQKSINDSLKQLTSDINHLKVTTERTENRMRNIQFKYNADCLIVHGMHENNSDLESAVEIFNNKLNININKNDISHCERMGKKTLTPLKPRPVIVRFCRRSARNSVFTNKKLFKGSGFIVTEMLTPENHKLFKSARECYGRSVWSYNGSIYAYVSGERKLIRSSSDLSP